ncbi:L-threonine O-3-phosphate decarboxylase [Azospirillum brasilense]|uniref:threonine-phosphate decarboxylase n=1 Tax=Azospirillum brasilense TaxID=192 RepID=A0A560B645_AZOBR|nr:threonine-phosphate decarboxylase CobD [Azospirillum brasilense]TWA68032.1 L-threonine O-3-phosphate decarboxylase [Azospirillum brasilense]
MMAESAAGSKRIVQREIIHGGDLDAARAAFPGAPEPWLDLSTGINPWPYPLPPIPAESWARLPGRAAETALREAAAAFYGAPSPDRVLAACGSQALIQILPRLRRPGTVAVLGPTYAEHAAGWAKAGHRVAEVESLERCDADVVVVVNPNNPDGRIVPPETLLALADRQAAQGGWLVVDEAFAEVAPECSVASEAGRPGLVILRSFGKFFGLAGVRLGFLLGEPALLRDARAAVGPWAVSGPALAIATAALSDSEWVVATRRRLADAAARFDARLMDAGLRVAGGTSLFRLIDDPRAAGLYNALGRAGILVRRFDHRPEWLRVGLPVDEAAEGRAKVALETFEN